MNALQKKKFAIQYGMSHSQFASLSKEQQQLLVVANNSIKFSPEEQLMLAFILTSYGTGPKFKSILLALALQRELDNNIIHRKFGEWQRAMVESLNTSAGRASRMFGRTLQKFTRETFPSEVGPFVDFLEKRGEPNDSMSISDQWRADVYHQLVGKANVSMKMLQSTLRAHNNITMQKKTRAAKAK